ncbi:uncharacterized protein LOC132393319 isoform X1 [Hypanus sabinus]|uniref:uncharacterized protein LOC132393319 isoform X1 n=1 Tax=Hypanus sabinus TaxID=79690 RepID=UPI0028C42D9A|nr:uncharacterized protein LOC132393319 isoform X1 [Hypanus sabinus]
MNRFLKRAGRELEKVGKENILQNIDHNKINREVKRVLKQDKTVRELTGSAEPLDVDHDADQSIGRKLEVLGKQHLGTLLKNALEEVEETNLPGGASEQGEPTTTNTLAAETQNEEKTGELKEKLQNVFQQGKVPFYVRTLTLCGYRSAGKTTLLRRLLNEPFREDEPITDGIRIGQINIKNWEEKIDNPSDDLTTAIATCVLNTDKQPLEGTPEDQEESSSHLNEEPKDITEDPVMDEHFTNEILMKLQESSECSDGFSVFRYYDFGGHVEYQQMHMPFLPQNAVYLLVVNLNLGLNDKLPAKERPLRGQKVMDTCGYTVKDYLDYWIRCISSLSRDHKDTYRVILVGTFAKSCSNAEETLSNIYSYLQNYLSAASLYAEKFAVDNSVDDDQGVGYTELRLAIESLSREVAFEDNIVLCNAKLYYHILNCSEKYLLCSDKYLSWYDTMGSPQGTDVSNAHKKLQVQAALQVLNCMKFAYFSEPVLVLDPQWLIDLMAALIPINCAPPLKIQTAPFPIQSQWMKLVNSGKFSESLLDYIWPNETLKLKDELLEILKSLNLVVLSDPASKCYHLWFKRKQREVFLCLYENQAMGFFQKDIFNELIPMFQKEWPYIESLDATFVQLEKKKNADYKIHLELRNDRVLLVNKNEFEHDDFVYKVGSIVECMQKRYPTLCLFVDGKPYKAVELFLQVRKSIKKNADVVNIVKVFMEDKPERQKDIFFRDQSIDIRFDTTTEDMVHMIQERMLIKTLAELNWFHGPDAEEICRKKLELLPEACCFPKGAQLVKDLCELLRKLHNNCTETRRSILDEVGEILKCCVIQCMLDTTDRPVDHSEISSLDAFQLFKKAQPGVPESAIRDIKQLQNLSTSDECSMSEDFIEKLTISIHRLFWITNLVFVKCVDEKNSQERCLEEKISNLYFKTYQQYVERKKELDMLRNQLDNLTTAINTNPKVTSCRDWLHKNFSKFVQTMGEGVHKPLLDKLYEKHLNEEEISNISSNKTRQERNRELLRLMINKGEETCKLFLHIFCSEDPSNEITRKLSDILLIRKQPDQHTVFQVQIQEFGQ